MTPRGRLLWQLSLSSTIILALLSLSDLMGPFPVAAAVEGAMALLTGAITLSSSRGHEALRTNLLLTAVLGTILLFDDGFGGRGHSWVLFIPIALAAIALTDPRRPRAQLVWLGLIGLVVVLVNLTDLTPRWNEKTLPENATPLVFLNFLAACSASWLCIRFLQQGHQALLEESHQLSRDLQVALDQAERASRAKGDFLSHMSHELRTPLNAISGFAQILLQEPGSPSESAENLQAIRTSADHLVHLVGDVLDLSRMEHGNLVLAKTPFHPLDQVRIVQSILVHSAREKGLALELDLQTSFGWVEGDPVRWRQVLLNLGSNAIKYTATGTVTIRLQWNRTSTDHGHLRVEVQDCGPGIPVEQQASIFRKFERLPEHEAGPIGGAGLGLAIARDLAESMGGTLELESEVGVGSTFTFQIPVRSADPPQLPSSDSWSLPWNPKGFRILLCEDNRLNVRLATQVLGRLGVEHRVATDGQEALDLLETETFDALLLDLHMPRKSGFDVARILRTSNPPHAQASIPILALTADVSEETVRRTREAGMNDFLAKPFHLPELEERLRKLLKRRTPARENASQP
jgi:signal transduction histidine kinase/CheY-like chemotaxis protein